MDTRWGPHFKQNFCSTAQSDQRKSKGNAFHLFQGPLEVMYMHLSSCIIIYPKLKVNVIRRHIQKLRWCLSCNIETWQLPKNWHDTWAEQVQKLQNEEVATEKVSPGRKLRSCCSRFSLHKPQFHSTSFDELRQNARLLSWVLLRLFVFVSFGCLDWYLEVNLGHWRDSLMLAFQMKDCPTAVLRSADVTCGLADQLNSWFELMLPRTNLSKEPKKIK